MVHGGSDDSSRCHLGGRYEADPRAPRENIRSDSSALHSPRYRAYVMQSLEENVEVARN
jgi:hypothetical protein